MRRWLSATGTTRRARPPAGRLAAALAAAVAVTLAPATGPVAAHAAPGEAGPRLDTPFTTVPPQVITLVTGDRVHLRPVAGGRMAATVDPAPRGGQVPTFETVQEGDDAYVLPSDAAPLIPDLLDRELFNVTKLAEYGYTGQIPVIVTYHDRADRRAALRAAGPVSQATVTADLPSIDGVAATIDQERRWWSAMSRPGAAQAAGVAKVWLDGLARVALDESAPMVGAPEAAAAGYDGSGQTVAVLDTGLDQDHPALAGKVVAAESFIDAPAAGDEFGHGTHVASIIAGSDDPYAGIAPGVDLISGKICDSNGFCPDSAMIDGMEWAASRADIINMSVGTNAESDGTDPTSQAVNTLTERHDVLFVVASGNIGDNGVASPGAADRALTVGAVDKQEQLAWFSGRGPRLGDFAIKPDLTAPGVDIVAARAGDATMPPPAEPVDALHIRASGTSMATPHVAGAAAILHQQNPDLGPAGLKALLAGTAVPHPELDVYQQGGGRLDIPRALESPVRTDAGPLNLGSHLYPHDEREPVTRELTYTNRTDAPVTLDLSLAVADQDGTAAGPDMLSAAPETLRLDPGASATAEVTLDLRAGQPGLYGGYLVASQDGAPVVRTAVGFQKEEERYQLTVRGLDRNGLPARGNSTVDIINMRDATIHWIGVDYTDGVATVRVPPGTYAVLGMTYLYPPSSTFLQGKAFVGRTGIEVNGGTTVVLDAREANQVTVDTPAHESAEPIGTMRFAYQLVAEEVGDYVHTWTSLAQPHYAMEIPDVELGDFNFYHRWRIGEPRLELSVSEPVTRELSPEEMAGDPPAVDGEFQVPLVYVGHGTPEDYQGVDVEGAVVLARRGGISHAAKVQAAHAAGARALVVANTEPANYKAWAGTDPTIPAMTISGQEGDALLALLDQGPVTVRLYGEPAASYLYDVAFREPDGIPADVSYTAVPEDLFAIENQFHGAVPGHQLGEGRHLWASWESISISLVEDIYAGQERVEYFVPGDMAYRQYLVAGQPFTGMITEEVTSYPEAGTRRQSWFSGPLRPGTAAGREIQPHFFGEQTYRQGNLLALRIQEWSDSSGHWGIRDASIDTTRLEVYENGTLLGWANGAQVDVPVGTGPAEYRLELDLTRDADWWPTSTETRTVWTVGSAGAPAGGEREVLPLLFVDYQLGLDEHHTAVHPRERSGPPWVDLYVNHQPGADAAPVAGVRVWVSYDGEEWLARPVRRAGEGHYQAVLPWRPADQSQFASVRVEAWDRDGNRIQQQITNALQLAP